MSVSILREFFHALGITKAPKTIQASPKVWAKRMTAQAMMKPADGSQAAMKAMG